MIGVDPGMADQFVEWVNYVLGDGLHNPELRLKARDEMLAFIGAEVHERMEDPQEDLLTELLWSRTIPESDPTQTGALPFELTSFSFVGEAGYMILARMLGATARFEWIDPNTAVEDEGDNWMVTAGAHFQFIDQLLKLQAEYTHRHERFGGGLGNDTVTISLQGMLDPARPRGLERDDLPVDGSSR